MYGYVYYVHSISCMCIWLADCWVLTLKSMCMISWMIRPLCEIVGTQNCFSTLCHTPYTNIKTSAQNAPKCTTGRQKINNKNSGEGHSPLSSSSPVGEGIPLHRPPPLGARRSRSFSFTTRTLGTSNSLPQSKCSVSPTADGKWKY